jgi:hypothetical protein
VGYNYILLQIIRSGKQNNSTFHSQFIKRYKIKKENSIRQRHLPALTVAVSRAGGDPPLAGKVNIQSKNKINIRNIRSDPPALSEVEGSREVEG